MVALAARRRAYQRRPHELNDPNLPPDAEVNKLQKVFSVRVDPSLKERFEEYVRREGLTKRAATERAMRLVLGESA